MAKNRDNYYYVRCSAYAELDGKQLDITGFEVEYKLDSIPTVRLFPTVGREPRSNKEAKAVDAFLKASEYTKLKVYAKFETKQDNPDASDAGFPYDKDVLVFDGYFMGISYQSTRSPAGGSIALVCDGAGWLTGLAGSTLQNSFSTAKGPGGFSELANTKGAGLGLFDVQSSFFAAAEGTITSLWLDYIKPLFLEIVNNKSVWGESPNTSALAALQRMDGNIFIGPDAPNSLSFESFTASLDVTLLAKFLTTQVGMIAYRTWRSADLWTSLRRMAELFLFRIVPTIDTAACAPVYPVLGGAVYKTITANDYHSISLRARTSAKFTKYVLVGDIGTISSPWGPIPRYSGILGFFDVGQTLGGDTRGLTIVEQAPLWIEAEAPSGAMTRLSLGGNKFAIPDAASPGAFNAAPELDYQKLYNDQMQSELGDSYAKARVQPLNLVERYGGVEGRFRLDIAPGSTIAVELIDDKFSQDGAEPPVLIGLVEAVTLVMSSGKAGPIGNASTALALSHLRSQAEHDKANILTSTDHPIYHQRFVGLKLWSE